MDTNTKQVENNKEQVINTELKRNLINQIESFGLEFNVRSMKYMSRHNTTPDMLKSGIKVLENGAIMSDIYYCTEIILKAGLIGYDKKLNEEQLVDKAEHIITEWTKQRLPVKFLHLLLLDIMVEKGGFFTLAEDLETLSSLNISDSLNLNVELIQAETLGSTINQMKIE